MTQRGIIDPEYAVREGWVRDEDNEISMDGYNAFIAVTTNDGTTGFDVINSDGSIVFSSKSDGDGYVRKKLGVGTFYPETELEVIGKTRTDELQIPTGAVEGFVLTSDADGNATWQDAYTASGGISEFEHRTLDQLVHIIAEDSFEEVSYDGSRIISMVIWTDSGKTKKIREEEYTYGNGNQVSIIVTKQYNSDGNVVETLTENYNWDNGKVTNITRTLT
jgi:hypothetical protein